ERRGKGSAITLRTVFSGTTGGKLHSNFKLKDHLTLRARNGTFATIKPDRFTPTGIACGGMIENTKPSYESSNPQTYSLSGRHRRVLRCQIIRVRGRNQLRLLRQS